MKTIIKNITICDGTGNETYKADVLINNDIIEDIGHYEVEADLKIEGEGKILTPGFIDVHRHCDLAVFKEGFGELELCQGITTVVSGNCGMTPFPSNDTTRKSLNDFLEPCLGKPKDGMKFKNFQDYITQLEDTNLPINIGGLIGAGTIKSYLKGFNKSPYLPEEINQSKRIISESMEAGAFGMSIGIMYVPECYSSKSDYIELAKEVKKHDGIMTCHIRGEGDILVESVKEVIDIAKASGGSLNISHFKAVGVPNWGKKIYEAISEIESARAQGYDIGVDFYPYTGGATTLISLLPPLLLENGIDSYLQQLKKEETKCELRQLISKSSSEWDNLVASLGWDRVIITSVNNSYNNKYIGLSVLESTNKFNFKDEVDFVSELLCDEDGKVGIVIMSMSQQDVDTVAKLNYSMVISDSLYCETDCPHPRLYATFPKILRDYVLERKILTLEQAVHKMTDQPARRFKIKGRGRIEKGHYADINIFDIANIKDNAGFTNSKQLSTGMEYVFVNGKLTCKNNKIQSNVSGKIIKK